MEVVSGIGDGVFWVGFAVVLFQRGMGAEGFALAAFARLGPRALLSAPAGLLADRLNRRTLVVGLDIARGLLMALLTVAAASGASVAPMFMVVFVSYTLAAPYRPAVTAAMPSIAGEDRLAAANALVGTVRQIMTFLGPVVGAAVVEFWSPSVAFGINAGSFLLSAILLVGVRGLAGRANRSAVGLAEHRSGWFRDLRLGWRDVRSTVGLGVISGLVFAMYVARGAELVLLVLISTDRLGLGAGGVGVLSGAVGLGAVCALPFTSRIVEANRPILVLTTSTATTAIPLGLLGIVDAAPVACALLFLLGLGVVVFEVQSVVILQRLARRAALGQVFGLVSTASNAGKLVGALAAPLLVELFGLTAAFAVSGVFVGACAVFAFPALQSMGRKTRARRAELGPIVHRLRRLGLFEAASISALERLAGSVTSRTVVAGTDVVRKGEPANDLFVVLEGRFTVTDDGRTINGMADGDWFGEIGLLRRSARTATVTASTDAQLWCIPGDEFLDALEGMATQPGAMFEVMAERLARSDAARTGPPLDLRSNPSNAGLA